ncbi:hypothetical protein [Trichlorobacter ammonificans]|uniref:Uncharacterized protein n=1 Tax=Trichlorobacter ammonificans TaxID=2916410 RepID=A0ABM9DBK3_9BACT|nr:hypothetical protein [Trichlorobacter ammonificans]CAH2032611.1 conserved protein of unknown function [Trichlorobacter ammonificans]
MPLESDNLEQLLADIGKNIAENRRFLDMIMDDSLDTTPDTPDGEHDDGGNSDVFEEL